MQIPPGRLPGERKTMKYTDGIKTVTAKNYKEAAEKLYGQTYYACPGAANPDKDKIPTTYTHVYSGYADVEVFNVGDKQGSYWGVQAARPQRYRLRRIKPSGRL